MSGASFIRIGLVALALSISSTANAASSGASKHSKAVTKIRVHVMTASGKSAGHARVSIHRTGHAKPKMVKTTGRNGNYTTGNLPAGTYSATAKLRGHGSGKASVEVKATGTHKMTIKLGKARAVTAVTAVHTRVTHSLGTKAFTSTATAVKKQTTAGKELHERPKANTSRAAQPHQ
jgi:hypothetical protein